MILGVFAGVGAGKSTVLDILKNKYDAYVIETDKVAHELYKPNNAGYKAVINIFGDTVLNSEKLIDRKKLGDILYNDREMLDKINMVIHPLVWAEIEKIILKLKKEFTDDKLIVIESALFPPKKSDIYNEIWYVYTPKDIRYARLSLNRGYSYQKSEKIILSQPSDEDYEKFSDVIIDNSTSPDELEKHIDLLLKKKAKKKI